MLWRICWGTNLELGEHIRNLMRIHWELKRNIEHIGNQGKMKKENLPPHLPNSPSPQTYKEKARHLDGMLGPSHWLHEISLPKRVHHHFWPGLVRLAKNTLLIES